MANIPGIPEVPREELNPTTTMFLERLKEAVEVLGGVRGDGLTGGDVTNITQIINELPDTVPITGTVEVGTVGALREWPTGTPPTDYLECDGSSIDTTVYADLFAVIGYTYGGAGASFNLPDYRGEFLRGWDNTAGNDPDAATRTDRGDGTTGDNVGTKQGDEFRSHRHSFTYQQGNETGTNNPTSNNAGSGSTKFTTFEGGNETRGRNVNVMICIRYQKTTETLAITGDGIGGGGTGNPTQNLHYGRAFG